MYRSCRDALLSRPEGFSCASKVALHAVASIPNRKELNALNKDCINHRPQTFAVLLPHFPGATSLCRAASDGLCVGREGWIRMLDAAQFHDMAACSASPHRLWQKAHRWPLQIAALTFSSCRSLEPALTTPCAPATCHHIPTAPFIPPDVNSPRSKAFVFAQTQITEPRGVRQQSKTIRSPIPAHPKSKAIAACEGSKALRSEGADR